MLASSFSKPGDDPQVDGMLQAAGGPNLLKVRGNVYRRTGPPVASCRLFAISRSLHSYTDMIVNMRPQHRAGKFSSLNATILAEL